MRGYEPGSAEKAATGMVVFTQRVKKILKKAKKLEVKYEKATEKGAYLRAARVRRSYMNLAKKHPNIIK